MNNEQYSYIQKLVYETSGNVLDNGKEYLIEVRLFPFAMKAGLNSVAELIQKIQQGASKEFKEEIVEALTINETFFFRDKYPFEILEKIILPNFLKQIRPKRELNIWSAACSSGQEIYSIAMLICHKFPELRNLKLNLVATDFSNGVLEQAKKGRYNSLEARRGLEPIYRDKYLTEKEDYWQLDQKIIEMVHFNRVNLTSNWSMFPRMDIVFMRNVLIYFDVKMRIQILSKLSKNLSPGAYLLLGGTETTLNLHDGFEINSFERNYFYQLKNQNLNRDNSTNA